MKHDQKDIDALIAAAIATVDDSPRWHSALKDALEPFRTKPARVVTVEPDTSASIQDGIERKNQRIKELETELAAYKKDNAYLIEQLPTQKHQKYLEGRMLLGTAGFERDRLEERLGDWQRETALAKADRDKLREALIKESEYQMGNYGSCAEWITKALEKTP